MKAFLLGLPALADGTLWRTLAGRLNEGRDKFEVDLMVVALVTLAPLGLAFSQLAVFAERRLLRWRAG